jgi:hypothetical protein
MGNIHDGHLSLVRIAREHAPVTVTTIFVNRLQFGQGEDFEKYPRTFEDDCAKLEAEGNTIVFAPDEKQMYPEPQVYYVDLPKIANKLEGRFRPDRYRRHTRVAGIDDRWTVDFDWDQRQVSIVRDRDDPLLLDMSSPGIGDALDPLSLKLEMRHRLSGPEPQLQFQMVEEDEIDEQNFRILAAEWMETSLGCLSTIPVEKIRHNSTRYTRAWHAPELAFIEVRVEHGKTDGNHLEMRITELTLDGVEVTPRPACAALQSSGAPAQ